MKIITALILFTQVSFAQNTLDELKWYLSPNSQSIKIDIDDLHTETIQATPEMDWGWQAIRQAQPKRQVKIAVIDTGIDIAHPDIKDFILYNSSECFDGTAIPPLDEDSPDNDDNGYKADCIGWNFVNDTNLVDDDQGHGTHVSGIITNVLRDHSDWFKILPIKVFSAEESKNTANSIATLPRRLEKAIQYAKTMGVDIIHFSSGWPNPVMTRGLQTALRGAINSGIAVISAAGNSSQRANIWPCREEGVFCVGALRANGDIARFSNYGNQVDVFAPGEKILSTIPMSIAPTQIKRKGFDYKNGTSQAAPIVTASFALLKSLKIDLSNKQIYSKLLSTAKSSKGYGKRGLIQVDKAISASTMETLIPSFKKLNTLEIRPHENSIISFAVENISENSQKSKVTLNCHHADVVRVIDNPTQIAANSEKIYSYELNTQTSEVLNCKVTVNGTEYAIQTKLLQTLPEPLSIKQVDQSSMKLIYKSAASINTRLDLIKALKDEVPQPLYVVTGQQKLIIYKQNLKIGELSTEEGCKRLRLWQANLNQNKNNEFIVEYICDDEYLKYQFLDQNLNQLFQAVNYRPQLTLFNYNDFKLVLNNDAPPTLEFISTGLMPLPENPWDPVSNTRLPHLYIAEPVFENNQWNYKVSVNEDHKSWQKQLGLRYLPTIYTLHRLDDRLLIKIGEKTAWVDIETQTATWTQLDEFIIEQNSLQKVYNTNLDILQAHLTPYNYRGVILDGDNMITLRAEQMDLHDPFMTALSTVKTSNGYTTVIRSFLNIWHIHYDFKGNLLKKNSTAVDRFDFLTAMDMMAMIQKIYHNNKLYYITDASTFISDYIDVSINGSMLSYKIPDNCTTQSPVELDHEIILPLFCINNENQFEMRSVAL